MIPQNGLTSKHLENEHNEYTFILHFFGSDEVSHDRDKVGHFAKG